MVYYSICIAGNSNMAKIALLMTGVTLCIHTAYSWAATTEDEDLLSLMAEQPLVSIATGSAQSLARAPAVATVITSEDIEAMGARDIDEVLESVPGLHV